MARKRRRRAKQYRDLPYPTDMGAEEKAARVGRMGSWFEALGVKASTDRIRTYLNVTSVLAFPLFTATLARALTDKADGYQTAPQLGELLEIARRLSPKLHYSAETGLFAEPDWSREMRRAIYLQANAGSDAPRLASGPRSGGQAMQDALSDVLIETTTKGTE